MIHLDFESRSEVDIWECGAWAYSVHPSTEILCMAYAIDDGPVQLVEYENISLQPDDLINEIKKGTLVAAYNALFEECMWQNILIKKYGYPRIPLKQWRCVMAKSLASAYPRSLKECALALNAPIQKDEAGKRVMMRMCKPKLSGGWNDDPADFQALYDYCVQDVETERCVDKMLPDLIPQEQTIWFLDQLINQRGIYVDKKAIERVLQFIEIQTKNLNDIVADVSEGKLDGVSRRMAVLNWCKTQGVDIKGYTKSDVRDTLSKDIPDAVRTVLDTKLQLGRTSTAKYRAMYESTDDTNKIRDLLIYHGATTGRWSGKLIQLQNLPKGDVKDTDQAIKILKKSSLEQFEMLYPDVMGTLSACIRGMIITSPGHDLIVADYNAIEARVLMWLAKEEYGLKQFSEGQDLYVKMAQLIYSSDTVSKDQRALGKAAVLGCGYSMGPTKFHQTCTSWGIPISLDLAEKAVKTYREIYGAVRNSWYEQERAAIRAVTQGSTPVDCGRVRWQMDNNVLYCELPSKRRLSYPNPSLDYVETSWGEKKVALHFYSVDSKNKWSKGSTYGGKLVENITQAVARDLLAQAMLTLEQSGYRVTFSVHDEIVSEVPETFGSVAEFTKIMCKLPKWAAGLPIAAEGWRGKRYKK